MAFDPMSIFKSLSDVDAKKMSEKLLASKTVEDVKALMNECKFEITNEQCEKLFGALKANTGKVDDLELAAASGGCSASSC